MHLPKEIKKSSEYKKLINERKRPTRVDVVKRKIGNILRLIKGENILPILTARKDLPSVAKVER